MGCDLLGRFLSRTKSSSSGAKAVSAKQFLAVRFDIAGKAQRVVARELLGKLRVALLKCGDDRQMFRQRGRDALSAPDGELPIASRIGVRLTPRRSDKARSYSMTGSGVA